MVAMKEQQVVNGREVGELVRSIVKIRRPDLIANFAGQLQIVKYVLENSLHYSLPVLLSVIDEWPTEVVEGRLEKVVGECDGGKETVFKQDRPHDSLEEADERIGEHLYLMYYN